MRMTGWRPHVAAWAAAGLLAACGGGGGDPPDEYRLQQGYRAMIMGGESPLFTVSGSCHGSAWQISAPAVLQSFEGVSAYMVASSNGMTLSDCSPASSGGESAGFYDTQMRLLGRAADDGSEFAVVPEPTLLLPEVVRIGDSGDRDTLIEYTDDGQAVQLGRVERSFVVEPGEGSFAVANFVARTYDIQNRLMLTQQDRYRMSHDGALHKIEIDLQYATTSSRHLVLTRR